MDYVVIGIRDGAIVSCIGPLSEEEARRLVDYSQRSFQSSVPPHFKFVVQVMESEIAAYRGLVGHVIERGR